MIEDDLMTERINLRPYQIEAIQSFEQNDYVGILDMATGTGKTITSIAATSKYHDEHGKIFLVIIVPYLHLIDQWFAELNRVGWKDYIRISGSKKDWMAKIDKEIWNYNYGINDKVLIIGSYRSMAKKEFRDRIKNVKGNSFLIADECHYAGQSAFREHSLITFDARLGLSATPRRWWDEEGTREVNRLFGKVVFEFSLQDAIAAGFLTPYNYNPIVVSLTDEEYSIYADLTIKISKMIAQKKLTKEEKEILKNLILKRARIIQNAEGKLDIFYNLILEQQDLKYTLVYCGVGQVDKIVRGLADRGIATHRFNWEVSQKDRKKVLDRFENGDIQVLVAVKCLDEGVDIPATREAYFLASTTNPREFVQRRGRILRKSKEKRDAKVNDFIVLPSNFGDYTILKNIAQKELPRFAEFSSFAENEFQSRTKISGYLEPYHLEYLMNILPWEMYEMNKIEEEILNDY